MSVTMTADDMKKMLLAMQAKLAAVESENVRLAAAAAAAAARTGGEPGWYPKTIKDLTAEQIEKGSKKGLLSAERILPGGLVVSYYVGGNGKLTIGGTYATRGVTLWNQERSTLLAYRADTGPDGETADLDRIAAAGVWGTGEGVAKKKKA